MKCAIREINKLVEDIRLGRPPEVPKGKHEVHYHDPMLPNFYIRVLDTGIATWTVQWKKHGRQNKKAIGDVQVLDRTQAIKVARDILAKIQIGLADPNEARRERMRAAKVTFATMAPLFMKDNKKRGVRDSTIEHWQRYLTGYYVKPLHNYPIDELTRVLIQKQIDIVADQSGKRTAKAVITALGVFFNWALDKGYLPEDHHNPIQRLKAPEQDKPRERVLTNDEIRQIWKACDALEIEIKEMKAGTRTRKGHVSNIASPHATKLAFLTGLRRQEIGELKWSEVNLDRAELRIPAERMKNNQELRNPLSEWAVKMLRNYKRRPSDDYVFPPNYGGNRDLDNTTIQINRRIKNAGGVPPEDWTFHDIRRTFRTRLGALGVSSDIGEELIGHVTHKKPMQRIYDRHDYLAEKRNALAMWETNLRAIIAGTAEKIVRPQFGQRKKGGAA